MAFPVVPQNVTLNTNAPAQAASAFLDSFNRAFKTGEMQSALARLRQGDQSAIYDLYRIAPDVAANVSEQMRADQKQREADQRLAARNQYYLDSNPDDQAAASALANGGDANDIITQSYKGAQTDKAESQMQIQRMKVHMQTIPAVLGLLKDTPAGDDAAWAATKQRALSLVQGDPEWTRYITSLGDHLTPEAKDQLMNEGMTAYQEQSVALKQLGIDYSHEDRQAAIAQSNTNNIRTTSQSNTNNIRSTQTSAANNIRSTSTSAGNNMRTNETTRGSATYNGGLPPAPKPGGAGDLVGPKYHKNGQVIQYSKSAGGYVDVKTHQRVQ